MDIADENGRMSDESAQLPRERASSDDDIAIDDRERQSKCALRCDVCGRAFRYAKSLSAHRLRHGNESVYTCKQCGQSFGESRARLLRHIRREHVRSAGAASSEAGQCSVCGIQVLHLAAHAASHSAARFVCAVCGRAFSKRTHYHSHCATHSLERPFACALCPAAFRKRGNLLQHERTHEKRRDGELRYLPVRPRGVAMRQIEREAEHKGGQRQSGTCDRACDTADLASDSCSSHRSHGDLLLSSVIADGGNSRPTQPQPAPITHQGDDQAPSANAAGHIRPSIDGAAITQSHSNDQSPLATARINTQWVVAQSPHSDRIALPRHSIDIDSPLSTHRHGDTRLSSTPAFFITNPQLISIAHGNRIPTVIGGDPRPRSTVDSRLIPQPIATDHFVPSSGRDSPATTTTHRHGDTLLSADTRLIPLPLLQSVVMIGIQPSPATARSPHSDRQSSSAPGVIIRPRPIGSKMLIQSAIIDNINQRNRHSINPIIDPYPVLIDSSNRSVIKTEPNRSIIDNINQRNRHSINPIIDPYPVLIDSSNRSVIKTEPHQSIIDNNDQSRHKSVLHNSHGKRRSSATAAAANVRRCVDDRILSAIVRERWANVECNSIACDTSQADRYATLVTEINAAASIGAPAQ